MWSDSKISLLDLVSDGVDLSTFLQRLRKTTNKNQLVQFVEIADLHGRGHYHSPNKLPEVISNRKIAARNVDDVTMNESVAEQPVSIK